jgi:DNA-binding MarR family transcriptional regulator
VEYDPDDLGCVCAGLRMATRAVTRIYDDALRAAGLRTTQYSILAMLRFEGPFTLTRLADRLVLDRTTLARELEPLRRRGFVSVTKGGRDRRQREIALTEEGRAALRQARPLWEGAQAEVVEALGESRTGALLAELGAVVAIAAGDNLPRAPAE